MIGRLFSGSHAGQGFAQPRGDKGKLAIMTAPLKGNSRFGQLSGYGLGHDYSAPRTEMIGCVAAGERLAHEEINRFLSTVGRLLRFFSWRCWPPDAPLDHAIGQRDF